MKSSSPRYTSNPSLIDRNQSNHPYHVRQTFSNGNNNVDDDDETATTSTYSFRHEIKKLKHAKSHGELYQPHAPLPLPPMTQMNNDENEIKYRQKHHSDYPPSIKPRSNTITTLPGPSSIPTSFGDIGPSASSSKLPLWKRFKQIITPHKRNKDQPQQRKHSTAAAPMSHAHESPPSNETSKNGSDADCFLRAVAAARFRL